MLIPAHSGIDWAAWITAGATVALAVGVVIALLGFWDARRTRDGEFLLSLAARFDEVESIESLVAFTEHGPTDIVTLIRRIYGVEGPPPTSADLRLYYRLLRLPTLIETVGVLHDERAISTGVIYKNWGPTIMGTWKSWSAPIAALREVDRPDTFLYFEKLAAAMNVLASRRAVKTAKRESRALRDA